MTLKQLTLSLTMLLALLSSQRVQTLHLMDMKNLVLNKTQAVFKIRDLVKQTRPGTHINDIVFQAYSVDEKLCPVKLLEEYIKRTKKLTKSTKLFVSFSKPHAPVGKSTISRWIKMTLAECGLHKQFTAHSTRSASTSKAFFAGVPIATIMNTAGWRKGSTFAQFYRKPIAEVSMASALMDDV